LELNKTYYRRHLPHYQPEGYTFFITFRLTGSLPHTAIEKLKSEYKNHINIVDGIQSQEEKRIKYSELKWNYFENFDSLLDKYSNNNFLKNISIAKLVYDSILFRDKKDYDLICFTIMPNHVHLVFSPVERFAESLNEKQDKKLLAESLKEKERIHAKGRIGDSTYIVTKILQDLKKYTARECNKLLDRSGAFWQHESYDHVVRNEVELNKIVEYVLNNPAKAKLVENPYDWKWSYCKYL